VLHLAVHSFTPVWAGQERNADIGLLYDPRRIQERRLCQRWQRLLGEVDSTLRVRRNYPYLGRADGLTTALRQEFAPTSYLGIELEVNQAVLAGAAPRRRQLQRAIVESLKRLLK
jgi:predicted N-formylglutamate amidohydrolase